jgi:hypothetical protein
LSNKLPKTDSNVGGRRQGLEILSTSSFFSASSKHQTSVFTAKRRERKKSQNLNIDKRIRMIVTNLSVCPVLIE